jgi:alpha-L-rhamnosidase
MAWVYQSVAGIDTTIMSPGFHEITIRPYPDTRVNSAHAEYESAYGKITTDWTGTASGPFRLKVSIPANTTAKVILPDIPNARVLEDGKKS